MSLQDKFEPFHQAFIPLSFQVCFSRRKMSEDVTVSGEPDRSSGDRKF